ncbi:MAG: DUF6146 family protein [Flavobacterium sp.]
MKVFFTTCSLIASLLFLVACKSGKDNNVNSSVAAAKPATEGKSKNDTVRIANDSLEYEVIIIDPGFNTWLYSRAKPRGYYGESYLRSRNIQWTIEWNIRARQARYADMYQMPIDYSASINYGYEVNYLLFNYLSYFQITNNQRLGGLVPRD